MEYIDFEAEVSGDNSDEELIFAEKLTDDKFLDNGTQQRSTSPRFYRFINQTRNLIVAVNDKDESNLDTCDLQPEMFYHVKREFVEFDEFNSYETVSDNFLKTLCTIEPDSNDSFFNAVLFVLLFKLSKDEKIDRQKIEEILGMIFKKEKEKYYNWISHLIILKKNIA